MIKDIHVVHTSESWMFKNSNKAIGYELAEDWIYFWSFYMPIATILFKFSNDTALVYKGSFFIFVIFAMTFIRNKVEKVFLYIFINILLLALTFILSFSLVEKIVFLIPMFLCFFYSIKLRREYKVSFLTISNLISLEMVILACYLGALTLNLPFIQNITYNSAINVGISFIIYLNISRTSQLMIWEGDFIKDYKERMDKIKVKCAFFLSIVVAFFLFLFYIVGFDKFLDSLTLIILKTLGRVNSVAPPVKDTLKKTQNTNATPNIQGNFNNLKTGKPNAFLELFLKAMSVVLIAVVVIVLLKFLYMLIMKILDFYKRASLRVA